MDQDSDIDLDYLFGDADTAEADPLAPKPVSYKNKDAIYTTYRDNEDFGFFVENRSDQELHSTLENAIFVDDIKYLQLTELLRGAKRERPGSYREGSYLKKILQTVDNANNKDEGEDGHIVYLSKDSKGAKIKKMDGKVTLVKD
ncbi:hypothetical protein CMI42_00540 [Candidatus Pacearchaeota archaeon]|nr:hypothetical protein [Candidatus Pacearchaeota archaeon]|tara:strand:+ start:2022 stop:2453 length:432 start_codon:yes stop_codon:yes gene_type:complete